MLASPWLWGAQALLPQWFRHAYVHSNSFAVFGRIQQVLSGSLAPQLHLWPEEVWNLHFVLQKGKKFLNKIISKFGIKASSVLNMLCNNLLNSRTCLRIMVTVLAGCLLYNSQGSSKSFTYIKWTTSSLDSWKMTTPNHNTLSKPKDKGVRTLLTHCMQGTWPKWLLQGGDLLAQVETCTKGHFGIDLLMIRNLKCQVYLYIWPDIEYLV